MLMAMSKLYKEDPELDVQMGLLRVIGLFFVCCLAQKPA